MLTDVQTFLSGKKTYLLCAGVIAYQLLGYWLGKTDHIDWNAVLAALGGITLRAGVTKSGPVAVILLAVLVGGCSLSPSADFIGALSKDPATVCVQATTPYGYLRVARTNITSGNVACNGDGLTVKSDGATIGTTITVVPQVSVAPAVPK